jgi:predicted DsbA family dithiol-disulfide isomerase
MEETSLSVTVYLDPICPFAWITSRWLVELETLGKITLDVRVMSLPMLNEHRELDDWYREFNDRGWGPARVCAAAAEEHGPGAVRGLYDALGSRIHLGRNRDYTEVVPKALAEVGLPATLADAAHSSERDHLLRAAHREIEAVAGELVGTPTVVVDGRGLFGPVLTSVPRGDEAVRVLDGVCLLAGSRHFAELKGARGELDVAS